MSRAPLPSRSYWRRLRARDIVTKHAALAAGTMVVPVPGLDLASEFGVQLRMVKQLCDLYEAEFRLTAAQEVITGIVGGMDKPAVSTAVLRVLSFASYFAGNLPSASLTAAYTYAVGTLLTSRLESTGRIDLPPEPEPAAT